MHVSDCRLNTTAGSIVRLKINLHISFQSTREAMLPCRNLKGNISLSSHQFPHSDCRLLRQVPCNTMTSCSWSGTVMSSQYLSSVFSTGTGWLIQQDSLVVSSNQPVNLAQTSTKQPSFLLCIFFFLHHSGLEPPV